MVNDGIAKGSKMFLLFPDNGNIMGSNISGNYVYSGD